jgi:hydrogenase/urease accessory protein HupE
MLLALLVTVALMPADATRAPLVLGLAAAVLGPLLWATGVSVAVGILGFALLACVGLAFGLTGIALPFEHLLPVASLLVLGLFLVFDWRPPSRWRFAVAAAAVISSSWLTTLALVENVSRSTASSVGTVLTAVCVLYASLSLSQRGEPDHSPAAARLLGLFAVVAAISWRLGDYRVWFDRELATEAALGLLRIPVLAMLIAVFAFLAWPHRRKARRALGIETPISKAHWLLALGAFLLLPIGTVTVPSPFFDPHAPRGEDARRVVSRVLSDTYHAFNIADENELYELLAQSVTDDLVDDLYLDSRRRLRTGTREGAQVTVRNVSVMEIGEPVDAHSASQAYVYGCRWVVTVRVQHLQHVHHRQNIYNGELTLRIDGRNWKIGGVELRSEERVVIPWRSS